jgi:hypothetical protein
MWSASGNTNCLLVAKQHWEGAVQAAAWWAPGENTSSTLFPWRTQVGCFYFQMTLSDILTMMEQDRTHQKNCFQLRIGALMASHRLEGPQFCAALSCSCPSEGTRPLLLGLHRQALWPLLAFAAPMCLPPSSLSHLGSRRQPLWILSTAPLQDGF